MQEDRASDLAMLSAALKRILDLPDIADTVVERAAADPLFLNRMMAVRDDASAVRSMMATVTGALPKWTAPATGVAIRHLSSAIARWAAVGFRPVDVPTLEARVAACRRCPHLAEPGQILQKAVAGRGGKMCGLCSCAVEKKAFLPTERCPAPDPERPGLNRWGDPHVV